MLRSHVTSLYGALCGGNLTETVATAVCSDMTAPDGTRYNRGVHVRISSLNLGSTPLPRAVAKAVSASPSLPSTTALPLG